LLGNKSPLENADNKESMKALIFFIFCAIGGYYAYQYFTEAAPTPAAPTPAPTPAPNLLPPGEFYTTERFSEKTEFGVDALPKLSMVKRARQEADMSVVVAANGREWKVPTKILDNNKDVLDSLINASPKLGPTPIDPSESAREARISQLDKEIKRQQLVLEELSLKRKRADAELATETAKPATLSGAPTRIVQEIRNNIVQLDQKKKVAEQKIEDAELLIKKLRLNDKPLPYKPPRL